MEHFTEVQHLLVSLVSHFCTGKKLCLNVQTTREIARKPIDNTSLSALVVKDLEKPSKSQNRNRARSRSGSNKRANKKNRTDFPAPVPRRNQPHSSDRGRPHNNSNDHKTGGQPQGRPPHSPQGHEHRIGARPTNATLHKKGRTTREIATHHSGRSTWVDPATNPPTGDTQIRTYWKAPETSWLPSMNWAPSSISELCSPTRAFFSLFSHLMYIKSIYYVPPICCHHIPGESKQSACHT